MWPLLVALGALTLYAGVRSAGEQPTVPGCIHACSGPVFLAWQRSWNEWAKNPASGGGFKVIGEDGCVGPETCAAVAVARVYWEPIDLDIFDRCGCS